MKGITLFKKSLPIFLASLSVVISLESAFQELSINASAETQENTTQTILAEEIDTTYPEQEEYQTVVSYKDVFEVYYRQASERLSDGNIEMPYTFEEFCDGYYTFNMEIQAYTDLIVDEAYGRVSMTEYEISTMSSSVDEYYIIKGDTSNPKSSNFDPEITPSSALQHDIYYSNENFDYSAIQDGDIVVETSTKFNNMGHSAFVYDTNKAVSGRIHGRSTYIQVIEAVKEGVQFGFLDDNRIVDFGVVIIRPKNTSSNIVEKAKYFHKEQLGKTYNLPLTEGRVNTSIDSDSWYCSELNYAGYYYAGKVIAYASAGGWIWPFDLTNSSLTKYVSFSNTLDARLYGKVNGKWKIRVYNYTGNTVSMYYNAKLAYENDAKNWTGLKDVNTTPITISNNSYTDIYIGTNVFATTAAISYTTGNKLYITYCNELNSSTLRMGVHKNVILLGEKA